MLKVSFDFEEHLKTVTNVKVVSIPSKYSDIDLPVIEVGDNRLIISPKAIKLMNLHYGDKVSVNYIQKNNEMTIPVIGKAETFADPSAGNKVSKSNTVSFKGAQRTILMKYGQIFNIKVYEKWPNVFEMIPISETDISQSDPNLIDENNNLTLI
jgi:hypothetical protein